MSHRARSSSGQTLDDELQLAPPLFHVEPIATPLRSRHHPHVGKRSQTRHGCAGCTRELLDVLSELP